MLAGTDSTQRVKIQGAPTRGGHRPRLAPRYPASAGVVSRLANIDLADETGAVGGTNNWRRRTRTKPDGADLAWRVDLQRPEITPDSSTRGAWSRAVAPASARSLLLLPECAPAVYLSSPAPRHSAALRVPSLHMMTIAAASRRAGGASAAGGGCPAGPASPVRSRTMAFA